MHIGLQQAELALLASLGMVLALVFVSAYLFLALQKARAELQTWQNAMQAVGADLLVFDHALAQPYGLGALRERLLVPMQDSAIVQPLLRELLENAQEFETTAILLDRPSRVKGAIKGGRAFVLASELLHNKQSGFEVLDDLPALIYIMDDSDQLIYANRAYKLAMQGEMRPIFRAEQLEAGHAIISLAGARLGLSLHKIALDKKHYLIAGFDISAQRELEAQLKEQSESYHQMLDLLPSAIAIFDAQQKLLFYNQAFLQLFEFEIAFLESRPQHSAVLEYLRDHNQLAQISDWDSWQAELLNSYQALDTQHYLWNLPNGKRVQIIAQPQSQGGVCWIYENLTSQLELQARYDGLIKRQGETLDNLLEGVALFNQDGKIVLSNQAFTKLWGLDAQYGMQGLHISELEPAYSKALTKDSVYSLPRLLNALTSLGEKRSLQRGQLDLKNGDILEYSICPLPAGQSMLRFMDVTAKMRIARALSDKNEALLRLDKMRNDFVQYMGYELRTPLTSIIGFTQLIKLNGVQGLALAQQKYLDDVEFEAGRLQSSLDNTIDLVNLNAGIIKLENQALDIAALCQAASDKATARLQANELSVAIELPCITHSFYGDAKRIEQLLTSILHYISLYAPHGEQIKLAIVAQEASLDFNFHTIAKVPFFEEDAALTRRLDLSLAKSLAELLQGKIKFNPGTTHRVINVQLPLEKHA